MINEILRRDDVRNLISEIKNNEKYYKKTCSNSDMYFTDDISVYVFYEALLKYYIIFDNINYLSEYIYDIDLLFRKIESIEDIRFGISKLITKFSMKCLDLVEEDKEKILDFVFSNYITNGFLIHGFSSIYDENIVDGGFKTSNYFNYYEDFIKLNNIFKKYGKENFINKNFIDKTIYFSDDIVKTCIYSINSPMYFCNLLTNNELIKNKEVDYYKDNYNNCIDYFNKIMTELKFSDEDKNFSLDLINKEWDLLHRKKKSISLLLARRDLFELENISLKAIVDSDLDINEAVDKILNVRYKNIPYDKDINIDDLGIINFEIINRDIKEEKGKEEEKKIDFNDTYGMISPLLLLGSLLISLGVIISIIHVLGG